ncbi:hypothetical protein [Streptomyces sp. NPDC057966]|uniref:hypothetical protein n=1 Tax=Streptomyces sp. NPDC057966 TaxID=3346292 RepID=UPI0036E22576
MFGKKMTEAQADAARQASIEKSKSMTPAQARAALRAEAAKNDAKRERGQFATCSNGHTRYAGASGSGCYRGCRN